eukprot:Skav221427  [mRNA]  locus=scaffold2260:91872:92399:+ [translate_table: standard]
MPGHLCFQANRIHMAHVRPAILHSYGSSKADAPGKLALLAHEGWEPLCSSLCGLKLPGGSKSSLLHEGPSVLTAGFRLEGQLQRIQVSATLRALILLRWQRIDRNPSPDPSLFAHVQEHLVPHFWITSSALNRLWFPDSPDSPVETLPLVTLPLLLRNYPVATRIATKEAHFFFP